MPGPGVLGGVLRRLADEPGERDERERREHELDRLRRMHEVVQRDRERREREQREEDSPYHRLEKATDDSGTVPRIRGAVATA